MEQDNGDESITVSDNTGRTYANHTQSTTLEEPLLGGREEEMVKPREILINDSNEHQKFMKNDIKTTKYSVPFFIPKNLWEQFHRVANVYFLFICILQVRQ
jgi:hypothetical protein